MVYFGADSLAHTLSQPTAGVPSAASARTAPTGGAIVGVFYLACFIWFAARVDTARRVRSALYDFSDRDLDPLAAIVRRRLTRRPKATARSC